MNIHKKIMCLILAFNVAVGIMIPGFAATEEFGTLDEVYVEIRNVRFMSGDTEVFTLPQAGVSISAEVVLSNPVSGINHRNSVALVLAGYDAEGILTGASISRYVETAEILPTVTSDSLTIGEGTVSVHLMIWSQISDTEMKAVASQEYVLNNVSRDNRIKSFTANVAGNSYQGLVNHDLKTIRIYVPRVYVNDYGNSYNNYSSSAGDSLGPISGSNGISCDIDAAIAPPNYLPVQSEDYFIKGTPDIIIDEKAAVTKTADGEYTVTAQNGETAVYSLLIQRIAAQVVSNFNQAKLGTPATMWEIQEAGLSNEWVNYSYASVSAYRPGMFANVGKKGGGYWRFDENSVTYANEKGLGFADDSPLTVELPYKSGNTTDRYARINSNKVQEENYSFWYIGSGMKDRKEMFASFDYMEKGDYSSGAFRLSTSYCEILLRGNYIQARVNSLDNNWLGHTVSSNNSHGFVTDGSNGGYSSIRSIKPAAANGIGEWNNLQYVTRVLENFEAEEGKFAAITEIYLNGEYVGYVYANDFVPLSENVKWLGNAANKRNVFGFKSGYNTSSSLCLDNLIWGTPY